jgi:hypothetical protein
MSGYDEPLPVTSSPITPDQLTAAITDLACSVVAIQSYLGIPPLQPASWLLLQSAVVSATGFLLRDVRLRHDAAAVPGRAADGATNIAADRAGDGHHDGAGREDAYLQGVCGGAATGCGTRPPSTPAAAGDAPTYARGDLGDGRPQLSEARSRPKGWPPATAPTHCCLQARAW